MRNTLSNGLKQIFKLYFMQALVMMLQNTSTQKFHPIFYLESPLPGGHESEGNQKLIRYKSQGHHTSGFVDRNEALVSINTELIDQIKSIGYTPTLELDQDILWNGQGVPADQQIRNR
jgi:hypothetical protein